MATKKKMLQAAAGQAGGGAGLDIDEVFSTYLYTGNGSTQTITNGIDLDGEGGLVWGKSRTDNGVHSLYDTERGVQKPLFSNATNAQGDDSAGGSTSGLYQFNSDGFNLGSDWAGNINVSGQDMASWTFRKAPKFFDVVTYTGDGAEGRDIPHNLGSTPGMIIVKRTDSSQYGNWYCYHRSLGATKNIWLDLTNAAFDYPSWDNTAPTDSVFTVRSAGLTNRSGATYVAYLFAHNDGDGEFGPDGDQDIIKCGTIDGNQTVDLGFEPQWVMIKRYDAAGNWYMLDTMRGMPVGSDNANLYANRTNAEAAGGEVVRILPNGLQSVVSANHIYIAIRRGPLAPPESGTEVFDASTTTTSRLIGDKYDSNLNPPDLYIQNKLSGNGAWFQDRLRGWKSFSSRDSSSEEAAAYIKQSGNQEELEFIDNWDNAASYINYYFRRAPSFFDVVAYTGDDVVPRSVPHNLGVAPEMMWLKSRSDATSWQVYHKDITASNRLFLDQTSALVSASVWNQTSPTDSVFYLGSSWNGVNASGSNYIAYLFATLAGVSKVGSYTGNGSSQTIDCGFTSGARFVLIKCTTANDSWFVFDTARGIVSGNDPYLNLDNSDPEITSQDFVDPDPSGFSVVGDNVGINRSGDNYIFYAVA